MSPESTPPITKAMPDRAERTRNFASIIVLVLILSVSIGCVFYMAHPSLQEFGSTITTYTTTEKISFPYYYVTGTTQTTFQVTKDNYVTSHWTSTVPPYSLLGTSQNSFPTVILGICVSLIAALLFLLAALRRKPTTEIERPLQPAVKTPAKTVEAKISPSVNRNQFKFCRECGAKIPRDSVFCEECGSKLTG